MNKKFITLRNLFRISEYLVSLLIETKSHDVFRYDCFCLSLLTALLFSCPCYAQSAPDTVFYRNAVNNIKARYFSAIKEKAHLYNGVEYESLNFGGATGNPFFITDTMSRGSLFYDDLLYENIPLKYDMVSDILLTEYPDGNNTLQLIKDKIDYFFILGHHFIKIDEDQQNKDVSTGFYELLYSDKKVLVLSRREKKLKLSLKAEDRTSAFVQYDQYFIYRDGKYYEVNSEDDLIKIFNDKAPEIKKFFRTQKVKYKKNAEQVILAAVSFYTRLT